VIKNFDPSSRLLPLDTLQRFLVLTPSRPRLFLNRPRLRGNEADSFLHKLGGD
jgi:hypothetical protein